jgi:Domain of unknown function (DUF4304)
MIRSRVGTAQELFASAIKDTFAPVLRSAGLRGSGQAFSLPSTSHFALLGLQKSVYSDSAELRFTINLKVISKQAWERRRKERPDFPAKPSPNIGYGGEWDERIGRLLPGGEDKWWSIRSDGNNRSTIAEVADVIVNVAVPALRTQVQATT